MSLFPIISPVASIPVAVSHTDTAVSGTNATVYTFSSQSFGTAATDRKMVCTVTCPAGGATVSTLTIGGVSAAEVVTAGAGTGEMTSMWQADVPTGTTGTVVVTYAAGAGRCGIALHRITGAGTGPSAANDTDTDLTNSAAMVLSINCPANGAIVAGANHTKTGAARTMIWTNLTETYDETVEYEDGIHSGAADNFATEQTSLAVTATPSILTSTEQSAACASWGPA